MKKNKVNSTNSFALSYATGKMTVEGIFKQFCKERHAEDKGKNYNMLQEIYANTEFFDLSFATPKYENGTLRVGEDLLLEHDILEDTYSLDTEREGLYCTANFERIKDLTLPFANCFIHYCSDHNRVDEYVFVREYSPNILTGTLYLLLVHNGKLMTGNVPFQFFVETSTLRFLQKDMKIADYMYSRDEVGGIDEDEDYAEQILFSTVMDALCVICNLPTHSVVSDVIQYPKTEYFPRKQGLPTIKRVQPPIYYVLDKKEETKQNRVHCIKPRGHLEFSHSFNVRSHWRRINENSLGKDRNGEYKIKGLTFVNGYVKGSGELVRRLRIVK